MRKLSFAKAQAIAIATASGLACTLVSAATADIAPSEVIRLAASARVVEDIHRAIPQDYWDRARCVAIIPDLRKAAFIIGGEYGRGVMSCRAGGEWSAPAFMQLAKGSWGFQAGAEQIDVVLLIMNEQGVQKLLQNKVNLGVDASIAAGPIGRQGQIGTDAAFTAEILSYSRAQGLFAGINLSGGMLRSDEDANKEVYGNGASPRTILASREISAPTEASGFLKALSAGSSSNASGVTTPSAGQSKESTASSGSTSIVSTGPAGSPGASSGSRGNAVSDEDLRSQIADVQRALDRILADPTASAGTIGTAGSAAPGGTITIDRERLLLLRQQINALLAALAKR
jgi:lipid-binding SYLF domain-containing protein